MGQRIEAVTQLDEHPHARAAARRVAIATVLGLSTADVDRAFEAIAEAGLAEIIQMPRARA